MSIEKGQDVTRARFFEELRARAERALVDTPALLTELQATLEEMRHRWGRLRSPASQEEHGEQATDQAGDGKATPL
jgi:hypothetical protein